MIEHDARKLCIGEHVTETVDNYRIGKIIRKEMDYVVIRWMNYKDQGDNEQPILYRDFEHIRRIQ